jgi:hypothetical protein
MHNIQHTDMQLTSGTVPINGNVTDSWYCCPVTLVTSVTFIPITSFPLLEYITHVCQKNQVHLSINPCSSVKPSYSFRNSVLSPYKKQDILHLNNSTFLKIINTTKTPQLSFQNLMVALLIKNLFYLYETSSKITMFRETLHSFLSRAKQNQFKPPTFFSQYWFQNNHLIYAL